MKYLTKLDLVWVHLRLKTELAKYDDGNHGSSLFPHEQERLAELEDFLKRLDAELAASN